MILEVVVRIQSCQLSEGRIALNQNEMLVIIHLKNCLIGLSHFPNQYKSYLNRITDFVIDLDRFTVEIACPQGHSPFDIKRIYPEEAVLPDRTLIGSEKNHNA